MATVNSAPAKRSATTTTIFAKLVMAVSGILFILYVLAHMAGNLWVFAGQEGFDAYAHHLRTFGEPMLPYGGFLWTARIVLLLALVGHAWAAFTLWNRANHARSKRYVVKKAVGSTLASRTMRWGGLALLAFVVFHILHLTTHTIAPQGDLGSPYQNYVQSFEIWWVLLVYVVALLALGLHLYHGVFSSAQTLGLTTRSNTSGIRALGAALAAVVVVGFLLPPFLVAFGIIG